MREQAYGFKADADAVIKAADAQLLRAGWSKEVGSEPWGYTSSGASHNVDFVTYSEAGGLGRWICIEEDCARPAANLVVEYGPGWVGITIDWPKDPPGWQTQVRHWFFRLLRGDP